MTEQRDDLGRYAERGTRTAMADALVAAMEQAAIEHGLIPNPHPEQTGDPVELFTNLIRQTEGSHHD